MRILAALFPLRAHFNTMYGLHAELRDRGHTVAVVCPELQGSPYCAGAIEQLGVRSFELPGQSDGTAAAVVPSATTWRDIVADPARQLDRYREAGKRLAAAAPRLHEIVRDFCPDVMTIDPMFFSAAAVASGLDIPYVAVHSCLGPIAPEGIRCPRSLADPVSTEIRAATFAEFGGQVPAFRYLTAISPHLNIVWHTPALVGAIACRREPIHLVGPSMVRPHDPAAVPIDPDWSPGGDKVAYVAFGSMANQDLDVYQRVLAACRSLGLRVLLSCPEWMVEQLRSDRVTCTTDQIAALELADVHVGYPGAATLMESMHGATPIVSLPRLADHAIQAHFIERAGVGRSIPYTASIDQIRDAVAAVLAPENGAAQRTRRVAQDYRRARPIDTAASLVESLRAIRT
jgi:UDP:flavonoid glycosyltransferase YjiC (YdhE family)